MIWPTAPGVVRGERIATSNGIVPGTLHLAGGRVMRVSHIDDVGGARAAEVLDARNFVVMPGLVDTHVHINEPGRTEWEGFASATRAAAAGGITTLLDMPLNSVPATTKSSALEKKRRSAAKQCRVDVGFLGGVVPGNVGELPQLWADGVFGFKCFLVPSGVNEFHNVTLSDLRNVMPMLAQLRAPLLVHAELPGPIEGAAGELRGRDPRAYATYLASRPAAAEIQAVQLMIELARRHNVRVHIVHVSAGDVIPLLREARTDRVPITAETCPHYLTFEAEQIPTGATEYKCAPPIRGNGNRDALWRALQEGVLDFVVSDHSPCPPALKRRESGDFVAAWGGVASLELSFPVVWSEMRARSVPFEHTLRWLCEGPARLAGLHRNKGRLATGYQADFALLNPTEAFEVNPKELHQKHPITPYAGRTLHGRVHATYLRGQLVYADGDTVGAPTGRLLKREGAP
ncbi:MAG TPA: allantoinase AllB [Gemmatimonadaceae bacterium]|jgi:allantoinase